MSTEERELQTGTIVRAEDEDGKVLYALMREDGEVRMVISEDGKVVYDNPPEPSDDDDWWTSGINGFAGSAKRRQSFEMEAYTDEAYAGAVLPYTEPPAFNTERYATVEESGFISTRTNPLSTFGMDVDTASYTLLRRNINDGTTDMMPKDAVRIEEMINYFHYDYGEPEEGETFGVTAQIADCPWNGETKLLHIGINAKKPENDAPHRKNIVFLVDTSGSMYDSDKLPLAQDTLIGFLDSMNEEDRISIVTYAGDSRTAIDSAVCDEWGKADIMFALRLLEAGGGTNGEGGIERAYELAEKNFDETANNRVILLTDGDFNVGAVDESTLVDMVREKADGKIFLSVMGFGDGNYNDVMGETLADKGNGNYSYIDSKAEAERVMGEDLTGVLETVAKDAKIQVDFNPAQVKGYRLIGYEDRALEDTDFADDTKDGGEVGAGQQVTVLYEIVTADSSMDIPSAHSRYSEDETETESAGSTETDGELLTVCIRYKEPLENESVLKEQPVTWDQYIPGMSDNMSWAAGVAQTGMLVRGSEYAGDSSYEGIYDRLSAITDNDPYREEFTELIRRIEKDAEK